MCGFLLNIDLHDLLNRIMTNGLEIPESMLGSERAAYCWGDIPAWAPKAKLLLDRIFVLGTVWWEGRCAVSS